MYLRSSLPAEKFQLGGFQLFWHLEGSSGPFLEISKGEKQLWSSVPGQAFLAFARARSAVRESRGFFDIQDDCRPFTEIQTVETIGGGTDGVTIAGRLEGQDSVGWCMRVVAIDDAQVQMTVAIDHQLDGEKRVRLRHACSSDDRVFGFGAQFTHVNLRGRSIDVLSQEPGIGRGVQPLTWFMNTVFGAGGDDTRSNAPAPHYVTSSSRSFCLENHELSRFDLRQEDCIDVEVWSDNVTARVFAGVTPGEHIESYTRFCGRMPPLPEWIQQGAVVGMQGGTESVLSMWQTLKSANVPIAAFWLQDWVGARKTSVGSQLWWNWELDRDRYAGWEEFREELHSAGARVLTYVNPFLVDVSARETPSVRNLFREAEKAGYLVRNEQGTPYLVKNTSFSAGMVDLSNPEAREWLKSVLREQVLGAGASGWMADFGEALPFDACLHDGRDAARFHNEYPEAWAQLNREVIQEAGREGDVVFFARSGFTRSPGHGTLFWLGDQLTSWSKEDGIRSAVTGLLSSGFSGFSQNHSDIGGYTTTAIPGWPVKIPFLDYRRSPELLQRWIELNAFTAVFRTHEGNQPDRNHQIDGDPETLAHFARFARIFAALAECRKALGVEAAETGMPVVRHPWICFPEDSTTPDLAWQFMLGDTFMVAPVLDSGCSTVVLYLPPGEWRHLWSDATVSVDEGAWFEVDAPIGTPAVFFPVGDSFGENVVTCLDAGGDRVRWTEEPKIRKVMSPQ